MYFICIDTMIWDTDNQMNLTTRTILLTQDWEALTLHNPGRCFISFFLSGQMHYFTEKIWQSSVLKVVTVNNCQNVVNH